MGVYFFCFLPEQHYASTKYAMALCPSVGVLSKRLDGSSSFWHGGFLLPILHCAIRKFTQTCYRLILTEVDSLSVINWTVEGHLTAPGDG